MKYLLPLAGLFAVVVTAFYLPVSGQPVILVTPVPTSTAAVELVTNGDFSDGLTGWLVEKADRDRVVCKDGVCAFRFSGLATRLTQKIDFAGSAGDRLVMSAFVRATSDWKGRYSYFILTIFNVDGTKTQLFSGLDGGAGYVRGEGQIHAVKDFNRLSVQFRARSLTGRLWVREVSLTWQTD